MGEVRISITHRLFLDSSAVEQLTVNQLVAGSNPARGANQPSKDIQRNPKDMINGLFMRFAMSSTSQGRFFTS